MLFLALALNTFIFYVVTSSSLLKETRSNMMFTLQTVDRLFEYDGDLKAQTEGLRRTAEENQGRYTVLRKDGVVLLDTGVADASEMENHIEREEIAEALADGSGYAFRRSETSMGRMLYVARLSENGEYILRLAVPYSGMKEYLMQLLPAVLLSFAIVFIGSSMEADHFSSSITKPLSEISHEMSKLDNDFSDLYFEKCPYEEINVIADTTTKMSQNTKEYLEQLEKEKQIRQEFFSNASHELKTPITSIRGYVELLESGMAVSGEISSDFLKRIRKEVVRMTNLVDDILMISRLESRGAETELIPIQVKELMDEVTVSLEPQAAERGVFIHHSSEAFTIHADLRQMTELFTNLLSNAVKYNNEGGQVWIKAVKDEKDLILTVRDNGVGIPRESIDRIFERFYRVDKGRSSKQGGTGLGLAIVKHVVNFYHGTIEVKSEPGQGSLFTVRLPIVG